MFSRECLAQMIAKLMIEGLGLRRSAGHAPDVPDGVPEHPAEKSEKRSRASASERKVPRSGPVPVRRPSRQKPVSGVATVHAG